MKAALGWSAVVVVGVLALWLLVHVFISPVNPQQEAPTAHFGGPCWACHFVSESAEVRAVD